MDLIKHVSVEGFKSIKRLDRIENYSLGEVSHEHQVIFYVEGYTGLEFVNEQEEGTTK